MKCPYCTVEIHEGFSHHSLLSFRNPLDEPSNIVALAMVCPACGEPIVRLQRSYHGGQVDLGLVWPRRAVRPSPPEEVPAEIAKDFNEAGLVLADSPAASAALSRRCLQAILRDQGYTQRDLAKAIEAVLRDGRLPGWLAESVDAVRNIGNFADHPAKTTNSGEIVEVEKNESEWNLDVIEELFDFFYVQPSRDAARRAALNAKLAAVGSLPLKGVPKS